MREHLRAFLPGHPLEPTLAGNVVGPVSGAPYGSAGILTIPWTYITCGSAINDKWTDESIPRPC